MKAQPPQHLIRFLRWFCREDFIEEIEGDLIELFEIQFEQASHRANWTFFWWVIRYFRPEFIKAIQPSTFMNTALVKHNVIISYRGFIRNKTTFFINLVGLSTGLACILLIYLWVADEIAVDHFHENDAQLYQLMQHFEFPHGIETWEYATMLAAEAMKQEFPEVLEATYTSNRFFVPKGLLSHQENTKISSGIFATPNFFEMFSYPLVRGDEQQALADKSNILLSESLANTLFGTTDDLLGKMIRWQTEYFDTTFQISGILQDVPASSTQQFDVIVHYDWLISNDEHAASWNGTYAEVFLLLDKHTDVQAFNAKIGNYLEVKTQSPTWEPSTQFVRQYSQGYLYGSYENGKPAGGRILYVRLFSLIAFVILLIACINFINLSTAQASTKMKQVGVKKAIGASRRALIGQFLSESMLIVILSVVVAGGLAYLLLPAFNAWLGKSLSLSWEPSHLLTLLGIIICTGLLSGSYPAFYLSAFRPIDILKGIRKTYRGETTIRKALVIFQFVLSIMFIVGVCVIQQQIRYTQDKYLGYNRDQIICFQRESHEDDPAIFLTELEKVPGVARASNMVWTILDGSDNGGGYSWTGAEDEKQFLFQSPKIGYDVIETLQMEVIMGRSFSKAHQDDFTKIILNEKAVQMMGLENPIGKALDFGETTREIIGVVKDFHYGSIHAPIEPLILRFRNFGTDIMVRIQAGTERTTIKEIEKIFQVFHPNVPFRYSFLDEDYQALYESEQRIASLALYSACLAILISCLGLFGLATFTAERRRKEIGIRKVLGASEWSIVRLLSGGFSKMVLLAILIAVPISYLMAQRWLESFAYKIGLEWWFFALAAVLALLIAWLTVSVQTFRAAQANPIEGLRRE